MLEPFLKSLSVGRLETDLILARTRVVLEPRGARLVLVSSPSSLEDRDRHVTRGTTGWLRFPSGPHSGQTEKRPM